MKYKITANIHGIYLKKSTLKPLTDKKITLKTQNNIF
ncbi:hypothetical protein AGR4A_Cc80147 [Agrobacterium tumefaciens str. B6]|uniref:Uncharacterized protein n=1 Tax=Agrobacterium tumefaciens str. B6 TaxID=1183423 RepID=A0A822V5Y3_AGRTU|nr:hypothetical protein AGR4A_Cc80147 [Agrobacterium tumefaciens str. B6]